MNIGRSVFSQIMDFIPQKKFRSIVEQYDGEYRIRTFSSWVHFLTMAFAQLTFRESLRDIEACLRSLGSSLYHCGFRGNISRSTLADANERRPWKIFQDLAFVLIERARVLCHDKKSFEEIQTAVYAFDSTTIEVCLSLFPWAHAAGHTSTTAAFKLHTLLDVQSSIPTLIYLTPAKTNDMRMLDALVFNPGDFYVFDRGYWDFA